MTFGPRQHAFVPAGRAREACLLSCMLALMAMGAAGLLPGARPRPAEAGPARSDSTEAGVFQVLQPKYGTSYQLLRRTSIWNQSFDFGTGLGFMNFNNKTSFQVRRDSDRNEERRNGDNHTDVRFFFIPHLPVTLSMALGRNSVSSPGNQNQTDKSSLNLNTKYTLDLLSIRNTVDAGVGLGRNNDLTVRNDSRTSSVSTSTDRSAGLSSSWSPMEALSATVILRDSRSDQTSVLHSSNEPDDRQPTSGETQTGSGTLTFSPLAWLNGVLTVNSLSQSNSSFYLTAGQGRLEHSVKKSTSYNAKIAFTPSPKLGGDLTLAAGTDNSSFRVQENLARFGNSDSWALHLKGNFLASDYDATLSHNRNLLQPATSDTFTTRTNDLEGRASRRLSPRITVRFDGLVRAKQQFYANAARSTRNDNDELKTKIQPALVYTPNQKWSVTVSYAKSQTRQVQLNPTRANNTREDSDFSADFNISYQMTGRTLITQSYAIKALYTTYDFSGSKNSLLKTQSIVSKVDSHISPKVDLTLEHRFILNDSGPFSFGPGGERLFARNNRTYRQELTPEVVYDIAPWISIDFRSHFLRIDNVNEGTGLRATIRNLDLTEGVTVSRTLANGVRLDMAGSYVRSNTQRSYWTVTSSLNKDF